MKPCPFCEPEKYVKQVIKPTSALYAFGGIYRAVPLNPVTPGHVMVIPRAHLQHPGSDPDLFGRVMAAAGHYAVGACEDFNLILNHGNAASQTIQHLHVHVVPRRENDGLKLPWTEQHEDS